jgi:hypothetical protein
MLYFPWRHEKQDILSKNVLLEFKNHQSTITANRVHIDPNHGHNKFEDLVPEVEEALRGLDDDGEFVMQILTRTFLRRRDVPSKKGMWISSCLLSKSQMTNTDT